MSSSKAQDHIGNPDLMEESSASIIANHTLGDLYQLLDQLQSMQKDAAAQKYKILDYEWARESRRLGIEDAPVGITMMATDEEQLKDLLESQQSFLKSIRNITEDFQSHLRKTINICSRPKVRALNLLDMPDEVLIKIFEAARNQDVEHEDIVPEHGAKLTKDIKNLRLTCRRFCQASSHLLVNYLSVSLNETSLSRLEEVSNYPTIGKGVQYVRVVLSFYSSFAANDFFAFAEYSYEKLEDCIEELEELLIMAERLPQYNPPKEEIAEAIQRSRLALLAWDGSIHHNRPGDLVGEEEASLGWVLDEAHDRYRTLCLEQNRLLEGNEFVRRVASAIARMPQAKILEICDGCSQHGLEDLTSPLEFGRSNSAIIDYLTVPFTAEEASLASPYDFSESQVVEVLAKLPGAIYNAGDNRMLTRLNIEITPPADLSALVPKPDDLVAFKAATQKLQHFNCLICTHKPSGFVPTHSPVEIEDLGKLLKAILHGNELQQCRLDYSGLWDRDVNDMPQFSLGPLINIRVWPKLVVLDIDQLTLHLEELRAFIDRLDDKQRFITFKCPYLMSGTWAEVLDLLKSKPVNVYKLEEPMGGECDDLEEDEYQRVFGRVEMGSECDDLKEDEYQRVFERVEIGRNSLAEDYIEWWRVKQNPLINEDVLMSDSG